MVKELLIPAGSFLDGNGDDDAVGAARPIHLSGGTHWGASSSQHQLHESTAGMAVASHTSKKNGCGAKITCALRPLLSNIKNWLTIFIITLKVIGDGDQQWLQRPIPLDSPYPSAWSP